MMTKEAVIDEPVRRPSVGHRLAEALTNTAHINPFSLTGTVFVVLLRDKKMYSLFVWMIFWLIIRHSGLIEPLEISSIATRYLNYFQYALTFVLTFFLNSTFADFREQGRAAFSASSCANNLIFMIKVHLKHEPSLQERLFRLLNAAHYLSWMDLAGWYSWPEMECRGLLSEDEIACLSGNICKKHPQVMLWVLEELGSYYRNNQISALNEADPEKKEHLKSMAKMDNGVFLKMQDGVILARQQFSKLAVDRCVPVPLIYTHMLAWFLMSFLSVLGFYAGVGEEETDEDVHIQIWWIAGYIIVVLALLSLYDVAMALREPFGVDITDIDPLHAVETTIEINKIFLNGPSMLDSEQTSKPRYSLFHSSDSHSITSDLQTLLPAKGPPYKMKYKPPLSLELQRTLVSKLHHSENNDKAI